jgi:predicted DNA-binding ribbon-helix-helix protein
MTSPVKKRSIVIRNHKTSLSLEDEFWEGLKDIALLRETSLSDLVSVVEGERGQANLSSAIRLFVLDHYKTRQAASASV